MWPGHAVVRARFHGCRRVLLGMGARLEKERFGARAEARRIFVQSEDHFQHDVLGLIEAEVKRG